MLHGSQKLIQSQSEDEWTGGEKSFILDSNPECDSDLLQV